MLCLFVVMNFLFSNVRELVDLRKGRMVWGGQPQAWSVSKIKIRGSIDMYPYWTRIRWYLRLTCQKCSRRHGRDYYWGWPSCLCYHGQLVRSLCPMYCCYLSDVLGQLIIAIYGPRKWCVDQPFGGAQGMEPKTAPPLGGRGNLIFSGPVMKKKGGW